MRKRKFTQEEDSKICHFVKIHGAKDWNIIAKNVPGRTGRQCRDRYQNYLFPGFFNGQWAKEEDDLLYEKYRLYGNKWSKITQFFPNRSSNSIRNRMKYLKRKIYNEPKITNELNVYSNLKNPKSQYYQSNFEVDKNKSLQIQNYKKPINNPQTNINNCHQEEMIINNYSNEGTQTDESTFTTINNDTKD